MRDRGTEGLALLFPGQGVGHESDAKRVEVLCPDLLELARELVGDDPFARIRDGTRFAQPAVYCASLAGFELLGRPQATGVAGHSLGEVAALAAAGAVSHEDGLRIVAARGWLMEEAARATEIGGMLAIGGERERAAALAARHGLTVANENSPRQFVLSGAEAQLRAAELEARAAGLRAKRLAVAGAFHSPAMESAVEPFRRLLEATEFRPPSVPAISGVTASPFGSDARGLLAAALTSPVRWMDVLKRLQAGGVRRFVDVGPGKVLAGLVRRTLEGVTVETNESLEAELV